VVNQQKGGQTLGAVCPFLFAIYNQLITKTVLLSLKIIGSHDSQQQYNNTMRL
jgi:hypothetical protein